MSNSTGTTPGESKQGNDTLKSTTSATLSRPSSRKTLRSSPSSNPLFASSEAASPDTTGQYAVYSSKKRSSVLGSGGGSIFSGSGATTTTTTSSSLSPSEGPLSPSSASSIPTTPPFAPTTAAPPLVSRPSNSSLPLPTTSRPHARSVSEAKEQLQKQALKAELQSLGLAAESVGAGLVGRLANLGEGEGEWKGIRGALASGKTTLLLPAEKQDPALALSPAFFLDHLILLDASGPSTSSAPSPQGFATLSGLRGYMSTDELVFTSCGTALPSTAGDDFGSEVVQRSLRGAAPPPSPPQSATYPSTMLISSVTSLSIPHDRSSSSSSPQPTLSSRASTTSRLAALFGKPAAPTAATAGETGGDLPPIVPAPAGLFGESSSSTPEPIKASPSSSSSRKHGNLDLSVLAVGKAIRRAKVVAAITSGVEAHLRESSKSVPGVEGESPVADHLVAFASRFQPPSPAAPSSSSAAASPDPSASPPSLYSADADSTSEAFQDSFHTIRLDLTRNLGASPPTDVSSSGGPSLEDFAQLEDRVDHSLEELESVVTFTLYDRLYAPPTSRDWQEDENLVSRIAALNVLDLDLEHLGLDLGEDDEGEGELEGWEGRAMGAKESLEELVGKVGKELDRLEDPQERTPAAKLAILVECHALLVDGLSKLPPVPLKKELGNADDRSSLLSDQPAEVEMDDASSRASSQPPSRPRSPTPTAEDELLKTPRPHSIKEEDVPEIQLPDSSLSTSDMSSSVLEATSSSMFDPSPKPSPPTSVFSTSRRRSRSGTSSPSTSSADLILPLLIYSVVRSNPPHLVSHLNYIHRYRCESLLRGQSSYCFTNFSAVVEFLTNIDVSALGISSQKILSATISPSPSPALSTASTSSSSSLFSLPTRPRAHTTGRIRGRVSQEIGSLAGTANTALAGVVDSSYRLIFSGARGAAGAVGGVVGTPPRSLEDVRNVLEGARGRARESLPFRRSFSTRTVDEAGAGLAPAEEGIAAGQQQQQREMVDIVPVEPKGTPDAVSTADAYAPPPSSSTAPPPPPRHPDLRSSFPTKQRRGGGDDSDALSVRSISSLLKESTLGRALGDVRDGVAGGVAAATGVGGASAGGAAGAGGEERASFLSGLPLPSLGRFGSAASIASSSSPAGSRRSTILNPLGVASASTSTAATAAAPVGVQQRFLDVQSAGELKLGEVQELLEGYRGLVRRVVELEAAAAAAAAAEKEKAEGAAAVEGEGEEKAV